MEFNVAHLLKSPVGTVREYDLEPARLRLDDDLDAQIEGGHVRLDRTNDGILARATVQARIELSCSRCLEPAPVRETVELAEEYVPSLDLATGRPLPAPEDDTTFQIDEHHILDLSEAVRQNLIAALPIQAVCREECAGLCPVCGVNRNREACACDTSGENRPFAALANLLPQESE